VTQNYYLPSMDKAIRGFSKFCWKCHETCTDVHPKPDLLTSLPICTQLNQIIHISSAYSFREKQKVYFVYDWHILKILETVACAVILANRMIDIGCPRGPCWISLSSAPACSTWNLKW
jgi:hypothetical protein